MSQGTVYTVASGKGGVGKTTVAVNVSSAIASTGAPTIVIDADIGMANLGEHLGIAEARPTLHDVMRGEADLADAAHAVGDELHAVPGSTDLESYASIEPDALIDVIEDAREHFAYVVIDGGGGLSYENTLPLGIADDVVLVSTPTPSSEQDTRKTAALAERVETSVAGLVVNRVTDKPPIKPIAMSERLEVTHLGSVPESPAVMASLTAGEPVIRYEPHDEAAHALRSVTESLTELTVPVPPIQTDARSRTSAGADEADDSKRRGLLARLFGW